MILKKLSLTHFRNYEKIDLLLEEGIHLLIGRNAQGKTNLLEAIYYISTTRSHRNVSEKDLIQIGNNYFIINARIKRELYDLDVTCVGNEKGKNLFHFNKVVKKVSDFIGCLNAVMFCPDDMNLFHSSPKNRRKFIDLELSKISKTYMRVLSEANQIRKERNTYLKSTSFDKNFCLVLTEQLIEREAVIIQQRMRFLSDLLSYAEPFYEQLSNDSTKITFQYYTCVMYSESLDEIKKSLRYKYEKTLEKDLLLKQTSIGINKEDFTFQINGKDIQNFASQGQIRSVLLAIKIALIHLIKEVTNEFPILLLDDVFSELDEFRRKKLLESLPLDIQIFITTTDVQEIPHMKEKKYIIWNVEDGCIEKNKGGYI